MLLRAAGSLVVFWTFAGALACVRDDWTYVPRSHDAGATPDAPSDVTDAPAVTDGGATDGGAADAGGPCPMGMVLVPAGQFLMGDPTGLEPLALPVHGVRVSAFCLDATEVTVAAYRSCPVARCTTPATRPACNWGVAGRDDHPINCVTADQALAFCQWRSGAGLPSEAQWEFAARGLDGQVYPWGSAPAGSQLCWSGGGTILTSTCAVRSFPAVASSRGLFDLGGNVSEITSDWFYTYTGDTTSYVSNPTGPATGSIRSLRGGDWRSTAAGDVRAAYRAGLDSPFATNVGFRCMRPVDGP